ncbi:MAG: DUF2948 family protein [Aestuariivirga sp.]
MLYLAAEDAEDLGVISAHMQDAVIRLDDIAYDRKRRTFALIASRYDWENAALKRRRRAGLHFNGVTSVKSHKIRQADAEAVLSLLSIAFTEAEAPGGMIDLIFSGGGSIRLNVECIDAELRDLGFAWEAASTPSHET